MVEAKSPCDNAVEKRIDRSTQRSSSGVTYRSSAPRRGRSAMTNIARHNSKNDGDKVRRRDLADHTFSYLQVETTAPLIPQGSCLIFHFNSHNPTAAGVPSP